MFLRQIVRHYGEIFAKATRAATVLVGGILLCASSGWMDPAVALIFRVDASGTFESGAPFAVSFLVNTIRRLSCIRTRKGSPWSVTPMRQSPVFRLMSKASPLRKAISKTALP